MKFICRTALLTGILVGGLLTAGASAQADNAPKPQTDTPVKAQTDNPPKKTAASRSASRYRPSQFSKRATIYYSQIWGVDSLIVKLAESGEMVRFSYRVLDPAKAKVLNDKKIEPSLVDPQAGVSLVVPVMDKVGKLRQTSDPEAGKIYWMAFSNKGRFVKHGDHVNVVIGNFRADGLVVN